MLLRNYYRQAGHIVISEGVQISNTISADATVPLEFLEFELGYNLTATQTFQITWDQTYDYPVSIAVYPVFEETSGFVYEDDVWEDDSLGYFVAKRALGDDIRVYRQ